MARHRVVVCALGLVLSSCQGEASSTGTDAGATDGGGMTATDGGRGDGGPGDADAGTDAGDVGDGGAPGSEVRRRVVVETDLGGDADDQASLVRFLLYANEWDVAGILIDRHPDVFGSDPVAENPTGASSAMEMASDYLAAYGEVQPTLAVHDSRYPSEAALRAVTVEAHDETTDGEDLLVAELSRDDPRPLWYGNWGSNSGTTSNLLRALDSIREDSGEDAYRDACARLRVVTLDGASSTKLGEHTTCLPMHVETGYPDMDGGRWYHRFRPLTESAGGFDVERDVRSDHGPLGALYTTPKEGDSWTFVYLVPTGLGDPEQPGWGGWAGRYGPREGALSGPQLFWADLRDTLDGDAHRDHTVSKWAAHLQNDFRARLDWCVAEAYAEANHPPVVDVDGDSAIVPRHRTAPVGSTITLSASGSSDPDGDGLSFRWRHYFDVDEHEPLALAGADGPEVSFTVPEDATADAPLHLVLEVTDDGSPPLTRYRRILVSP